MTRTVITASAALATSYTKSMLSPTIDYVLGFAALIATVSVTLLAIQGSRRRRRSSTLWWATDFAILGLEGTVQGHPRVWYSVIVATLLRLSLWPAFPRLTARRADPSRRVT